MYVRVGGHMLLSFSTDVHRGITERTLTNSMPHSMNSMQTCATFWIDRWRIHVCTKQPLDHW
jgi:hypothetical protein